jgi:hypothetical protein
MKNLPLMFSFDIDPNLGCQNGVVMFVYCLNFVWKILGAKLLLYLFPFLFVEPLSLELLL